MTTINTPFGFRVRRAAALAAGAGLLVALPLLAQGQAGGGNRFDRPLGGGAGAGARGQSTGDSTTMITSNEDGTTCTVKVHNNEVSAEIDGKPVPPDRIDRKGDVIIIKGEDGKTIKKFEVGGADTFTWTGGGDFPQGTGNWSFTPQGGGALAWSQPQDPPPVMVGVTMSDVDDALAEHLGLEEGSGFVIDHVVPDLPAAKAGLQEHDVVVAIDGKKPATQQKFREMLRDKKPGDTLALTVMRKGKEQKVKIELAAYDRTKLTPAIGLSGTAVPATPMTPDATNVAPGQGGTWRFMLGGNTEEARKQLENALKLLQQTDRAKLEETRRAAEEHLQKALELMGQARARSAERLKALSGDKDTLIYGGGPDQLFTVAPDRDVNRRLERLSAQLDKLDKRLDDMERRLSDKNR